MDKINVYEYSGIVCPGILLIAGLGFLFPEYAQYLKDLSIGAFGFILILSFCAGHILSAVGNILEDMFYSPKRWTDYKLKKYKITGAEAYARIKKNSEVAQLEIFNRLYGMMRGMFVAFVCVDIISIIKKASLTEITIFLILALLCFYRALHFVRLYANTLIHKSLVKK